MATKRKLSASAELATPEPPQKHPQNAPLHRSTSACHRCRVKKIKCDQKFPKCSKCEKSGNDCVGLDPLTGREVPRSYVVHLENKIQLLEAQLKQHGVDVASVSATSEASAASAASAGAGSTNSNPVSSVIPSHASLSGPKPSIAFSKLMTTAVKVNRKSSAAPDPVSQPAVLSIPAAAILPAILPPKVTALKFIHIFFAQSNSQLPVLHREEFVANHFLPIYGPFDPSEVSLASDFTGMDVERVRGDGATPWFDQYKRELEKGLDAPLPHPDTVKRISNAIVPPSRYHASLFFLNMTFAIAASVHHLQYPPTISESFRLAAFQYLDDVKASLDPLEALQAVLLQSLYATMRPTTPAVWYVLGTALRMCVDLDLHNENNTTTASNLDAFAKDKRRRLFWCTYAIDRQICFYLDRPVGIPDASIHTPFPSMLDDAFILQDGSPGDYSLASTRPSAPSYKTISLSIFRIRQIQSEVQSVLYTHADVPRQYATLDAWKAAILARLAAWRNDTPQTRHQMNCNFNLSFFTLNYNHTLLMLYNLSPKNYKLSPNDILQVCQAAKQLIACYTQLFSTKSINYTWAAVHNLFSAGTSFLYTVYNSEEVRVQHSLQEIKTITSDCLNVLTSLVDRCEAAINCCEVFQSLTTAIIKIRYNEVVQGFSTLKVTKDSLDKVNNNNIKSNLSKLVENLTQADQESQDLNPFGNVQSGPADQPSHESPTPTFEWGSGKDPSQIYGENFDLETFFKELESSTPIPLRATNDTNLNNIIVSPYSENSTGSPTIFNNSKEGKRTFELLHQTPNEMIWDQVFTASNFQLGVDPGLIVRKEG
ncbi:uncharacterized protein CANTADRAFT_52486 [Suhomyces tanzawaensis NRRL Y-17324]|uniref:Zn(2)-C6 fungal-type domain-containing protein n=1 Tax=Suhomyces tanzawaensis NRRL Y-17324 TaxID=984487 RepID=A0A1E4SGW0_9ASCO|nr:uncharacterized protein CANTADRAFT_52486 [Suhomyces tanzawaensis NRRL Y-17324]ODV78749.1 hypothetical protein CANTADRAFT_52486 [Suhomyces tanzawaensis NRRL Y-17324]